ncbi:hypothetical protein AB0B31_10750 [Catellatospora citrea]|uniref:hypothetical protein n=1 Tax=Catellatospora citrea TaxID=53366 RepID=UPI0033ECCCDB
MRPTIALAAGVAALTAVLAACVEAPGASFQVTGPTGGIDGAATYDRIITVLRGTDDDRLTAEARMTATTQDGIAACMAQAGFGYTKTPSQGQAGGPHTPGNLTTLAPLGARDFGITDAQWAAAWIVHMFKQPGAKVLHDDTPQYARSLRDCTSSIGSPEPFTPTHAVDLAGQLEAMFTAIEARPEVAAKLAAYGDCITASGFAAADYVSLYALVRDKFAQVSDGWAQFSQSQHWKDAMAYEQRAAAADTTCRADLRRTAMQIAAPQLVEFTNANAAQLQQAATEWAARRDQ